MNPLDFSVEELDKLFALADDIEKDPAKYAHKCDGKILATCFYEPSTRTRLSFETAMTRLGGRVIGFSDAASSSASKGESVSDTIRIISCYADICAMRHPKEGAPMVAAEKSLIPVINAGDGGHQHPTQTLADLQTIRSLHGDLNNFTIGLCGDLKFGRTVHSLINALVRYEGIKFIFISPEELKIPDYVTDMLREKGIPYEEGKPVDWSSVRKYNPATAAKYADAIARLKADGKTTAEVAAEFGLHPECFRQYLKEHEPELHASLSMVKTDKGGVMSHHSMGKYAEALQLYSTTTESIKSLARRFGFNDCAFGQFIRRHFPELHEQHKELVRQMKEAD